MIFCCNRIDGETRENEYIIKQWSFAVTELTEKPETMNILLNNDLLL